MRTIGTPRGTRDSCLWRTRGRHAVPRRVAVELSPRAVEEVAGRVAQLLDGQRAPELLTAGELARYLRVERAWVYKHRRLLGGQRIGGGPKAPWRFERERAVHALAAATDEITPTHQEEAR
ncbi:MAG: hypothetical protein ACRDK7_13010 [Solirubrobacteraceae bacterium]